MDELYRRPDRAAIAARVRAEEAQEPAGRSGARCDRPGGDGEPDAGPSPPPEAVRCKACGYLTTVLGHWWACGP